MAYTIDSDEEEGCKAAHGFCLCVKQSRMVLCRCDKSMHHGGRHRWVRA